MATLHAEDLAVVVEAGMAAEASITMGVEVQEFLMDEAMEEASVVAMVVEEWVMVVEEWDMVVEDLVVVEWAVLVVAAMVAVAMEVVAMVVVAMEGLEVLEGLVALEDLEEVLEALAVSK